QRRRVFVRERHQRPVVKEFGNKWRFDYWDNSCRPRKKRGKKWLKSLVPTKREAQRLADELMIAINQRNNEPHLKRTEPDTFAELTQMWREKISPHLKNSTRQNYGYFLDTHLLPELGTKRLAVIRRIKLQDFFNSLKLAPKTVRNMHA